MIKKRPQENDPWGLYLSPSIPEDDEADHAMQKDKSVFDLWW